jgi:hypothetical protein
MKLVLQNTQNNLFYRCGGIWTADLAQAYDFHQMQHLVEMVQLQNLHDVQAVVKIDDRHPLETISLESVALTQAAVSAAPVQPAL